MSIGLRSLRIDVIRGVAILLVLIHHFNIAYRLDDTLLAGAFGWDTVRAVARNGNYGVTMFFVISGYLITSNTERRWAGLANVSARTFYTLRAARILPCLLLLLAVVNLLAAGGVAIFQNRPQGGEPISFWLVNFASLTFWMNVLIGSNGWFNYPLGVLWSLSVEEVFYLAFPLLCLLLRREARLLAFWALVIVTGPFYRLAHQGDEGATSTPMPRRSMGSPSGAAPRCWPGRRPLQDVRCMSCKVPSARRWQCSTCGDPLGRRTSSA